MLELDTDEAKPAMREAFLQLAGAHHLTDVTSRMRINYELLLRKENDVVIVWAAKRCRSCDKTAECARWTEMHAEGEGNSAPAFCPVAGALTRLAQGAACAWEVAGAKQREHPLSG